MNIETLKKYDKKKIITIVIFIILTFLLIIFSVSLAKYRNSKSISIAKGTINYKQPDLNLVSVYLEDANNNYKPISGGKIPASGYTLNEDSDKTRCTIKGEVDNNIKITYENGEVSFSKLTTAGTKCYLYFDKIKGTSVDEIILDGSPTDDSMFSGITGDGVYTWTKGDYSGGSQTIKYYRGNVDNNWVVFGRDGDQYIWWRIIRNNSNGSLRMIYAGTSSNKTSAPATIGEGTQIGISAFSTRYGDNMYMGFKYTSGEVHGIGTNSTILGVEDSTDKTTLYGWYNSTLKSNFAIYLDLDAGFCNDRGPSTSKTELNGSGGTGTTDTYYASYIRLITNKTPSLLCASTSDIFKTPVGLITADEVSMGGMVANSSTTNISSYLYTNQHYWTMSPYSYYSNGAPPNWVFYVDSTSYLGNTGIYGVGWSGNGIRPVVNLKSDTLFEDGGNGTSTSPYIVQGT